MSVNSNNVVLAMLLLVVFAGEPLFAQRRSSNSHPYPKTVTVKTSGESIASVAEQFGLASESLAEANGLKVDSKLRRGQRLVIPSEPQSAVKPQHGELIGKRILFADGVILDVDDVWKQGETAWYRSHGTSQSVNREIRNIENRYKEIAANESPARPVVVKVAPTPAVSNWIYLVDGARIRVDDVREVSDGAWYKRDKLTIFLATDRITRIERDVPEAAGTDWKQTGWSSGNPTIDLLIRKHATRFAIDPYLVFLVIEQESHFRTHIVSPKGAQGLMQLMPGTARRFGVSRPFDAAENIRGGTQYLKELLTMFQGRVDLALASYNAGEGRVLDYGNRVPPFKETRDYVRRISSRYRSRGANGAAANSASSRQQ